MPADGKKPLLIAGGGIGGLATALAAARLGLPSVVLERRQAFSEAGAGIQLGPNGTRILATLGVARHLEPNVGKPDSIRAFRGRDGKALSRLPLGQAIVARHGAPYWVAHRADLQRALLTAIAGHPLITIHTGWDVTRVAETGDGVEVGSREGETLTGSGLVAADGVWSFVRRDILDAPPLPASRRTAARTVIPRGIAPEPFRDNDVGVWMAPSAHVVHYPVHGGHDIAVVVLVDDTWNGADWSSPAEASEVLAHTRAFAPELRDFLALGTDWRKWSLYEVAPLSEWTRGRVTLLGDAAHPPLPFLAQGGVMALEDALTLADCVAFHRGDTAAAFRDYEGQRLPRTARVLSASIENGRIYHHAGLMGTLRDLTLRLAPPTRILARYDWLYGWRAKERVKPAPAADTVAA